MKQRTEGKERFWRRHVELAERSGCSLEAYCRGAGISAPALRYWKKKKLEESASGSLLPGFIPVEIVERNESGQQLPDPRWVAHLIHHLCEGVSR